MTAPLSEPRQKLSFEDSVVRFLNKMLPLRVLKWLPTLYYRINRYRFRVFARPVMTKETSKARARRLQEGFFEKFCTGQGLDVGYGGDLVVPNARGWDVENGDAHELSGLADASFDFVYSSHLLEHVRYPARAVRTWWRVLRPGGHLILYVPDRELAERKRTLPSNLSLDHKHFFLLDRDDPPDTIGLIPLLQRELGAVEIVCVRVCDAGYCPEVPSEFMPNAECSIEVVARKLSSPEAKRENEHEPKF